MALDTHLYWYYKVSPYLSYGTGHTPILVLQSEPIPVLWHWTHAILVLQGEPIPVLWHWSPMALDTHLYWYYKVSPYLSYGTGHTPILVLQGEPIPVLWHWTHTYHWYYKVSPYLSYGTGHTLYWYYKVSPYLSYGNGTGHTPILVLQGEPIPVLWHWTHTYTGTTR